MKVELKLFSGIGILAMGFVLLSMGLYQQQKPKSWVVPENYKNMENPVMSTPQSINLGSALYRRHCASCHGRTGLGDGVKARTLKTFSGDFSGPEYFNQTDGEHFYKTKKGRDEMPAYEGKIPDEDIWHMVNYMRTFKK